MSEPLMFMVRVKLPPLDGPDEVLGPWKQAVFAAKPPGFEVKWARNGEKWPVDSEGFTFVPLYVTSAKEVFLYHVEKVVSLERRLKHIQDTLRSLV